MDDGLLHEVMKSCPFILTVEDGSLAGGFGSAVSEFMTANGYSNRMKSLGIPDRFIEQGTQAELYHECGFDSEGISRAAVNLVGKRMFSRVVV